MAQHIAEVLPWEYLGLQGAQRLELVLSNPTHRPSGQEVGGG